MNMRDVALYRFGGGSVAAPSTLAWYVPMNDPSYYIEKISAKNATAGAQVATHATGGFLNSGYISSSLSNQGLQWSGADAAQFQLNFKNPWTIDFWNKTNAADFGGSYIYISDAAFLGGNAMIISVQYFTSVWRMHVASYLAGVKQHDVFQDCTVPPSTSEFRFFRFSYNGTRLRMANGASVIYANDLAASGIPDLSSAGANMITFLWLTGSNDSIDNVACHSSDLIDDDTTNVIPATEYV